ncbi:MAG: RsgI [Paenibacillus sp.]|nr:RsgI [Paenibacillus sp.]
MNKGIVMEKSEAHLVVLTPDGDFKQVPRQQRNCEVGEEILFTLRRKRFKYPILTFIASISAAILVCILAFNGITPHLGGIKPIVAYVTLDINPSVELGIDAKRQVLDVRGLNDDGVILIEQLKYRGKSLDAVTRELLDRVESKGIWSSGKGDIIISSSKAFEAAAIDEFEVGQAIKQSVDEHIQANHPSTQSAIHVASVVAPVEIRQAAETEGVSAGKYALYLNAKNNGSSVTIDEIKTQSIHKIAEDRGGLDKLIDTNKVVAKETLSRLLQEEKNSKQKTSSSKDDKTDNKSGSTKSDDKQSDNSNTDNSRNNNSKNDNNDKSYDKTNNGKTDNNNSSTPDKKTGTGAAMVKPGVTPIKYETDREKRVREEAEKKKAEQVKKEADDKRKAELKKQEEEKKRTEQKKQEEEKKRLAEEKKKLEEQKKKAEEQKKQEEERKRQEEERKNKEERNNQGYDGRRQEDNRNRQDDDNRRD